MPTPWAGWRLRSTGSLDEQFCRAELDVGVGATAVRVMIADDSALFRGGLRSLLEAAGVEVVADFGTAAELVAQIDHAGADLDAVLLDIRMPPTFTDEGLQVALALSVAHPELGVLLLSTYAETEIAVRLLEGGSAHKGYLLKDRVNDVATLVDALARVARGESAVDPQIVTGLLAGRDRTQALAALTDREREVLAMMAEGRSNAGIAKSLYLSPRTVESHATTVFLKLGFDANPADNRRVMAVLLWLRSGPAPQP